MKFMKSKDAVLTPNKVAIVGNVGKYWKMGEDYARTVEHKGKFFYVDKFDQPLAYYDELTNVTIISSKAPGVEKLKNNEEVKFARIIDGKPVKDSDDLGAQIEKLMAQYKEKYGVDYKPGQANAETPAAITDDTIVTEDNLTAIQKQLEEDIGDVVILTVNFIDIKESKDIPVANLFLTINDNRLCFNYDTEDTTSAYLDDISETLYNDFSMDLSDETTYKDVVDKLTGNRTTIYTTLGVDE